MSLRVIFYLILLCIHHLGYSAPLPANEAFDLKITQQDHDHIILNWQIHDGYFLYRDRLSTTGDVVISSIQYPTAEDKVDPLGHAIRIYRHTLSLPVTLTSNLGPKTIKVHYQGCSDAGFCYPPEEISMTFNVRSSENFFTIILGFFGLGLLLSFTPCVLPMIPVLSGIIVGHGNNLTKRKALLLSLSYVLSLSLTYALVGGVIAFMGNNLQVALQTPWAIGTFSIIFILLALSMFGLYELKLPIRVQSKLAAITRKQSSGHYLSAAIMGCMSTLILSPCVTPPMVAALSYIASTGQLLVGLLSLFFLGLGMGTPLILIGISAGKLLPKAGPWMNTIRVIFGLLFLGVALYLAQRILPGFISMGLWGALAIFSGLYMGALTRSQSNSERFFQGIGLLCLTYGVLILIGLSQGQTNPIFPLQNTTPTIRSKSNTFLITKTLSEVKSALQQAKGNPVLLDFYADWCASCQVVEHTTLQNKQVQAKLQSFTVIKIDLTPNDKESKALLTYFNVIAPPTFLFFNAEGLALDSLRLVGEISTSALLKALNETNSA